LSRLDFKLCLMSDRTSETSDLANNGKKGGKRGRLPRAPNSRPRPLDMLTGIPSDLISNSQVSDAAAAADASLNFDSNFFQRLLLLTHHDTTKIHVLQVRRFFISHLVQWRRKKDKDGKFRHNLRFDSAKESVGGGRTQTGKTALKAALGILAKLCGIVVVVVTTTTGNRDSICADLITRYFKPLTGDLQSLVPLVTTITKPAGRTKAEHDGDLEKCILDHGCVIVNLTNSSVDKVCGVQVYIHICVCPCVRACMHASVCMCMFVCVCMCVCTYFSFSLYSLSHTHRAYTNCRFASISAKCVAILRVWDGHLSRCV